MCRGQRQPMRLTAAHLPMKQVAGPDLPTPSLGIGLACVVEPSASNMGYITLVDPAERRAATLPKDGNAETVSIAMDPGGGVSVSFTSTPQGQGHRTVAAGIVADALGVRPEDVTVHPGADTGTRPFTVSSGNYSSRFAVTVASAVHVAAVQLAERLRALAADMLECAAGDVELIDGSARVVGTPDRSVSLRRVAGAAHWDPAGLPDGVDGLSLTTTFSVPGLAAPAADDTVNSSAAYGFLADVAVVEVDPDDRRGVRPGLRHRPRRRPGAPPRAGRRPGARRPRPRPRRRPARAPRLRRRRQPAHEHLRRLPDPDRHRAAPGHDRMVETPSPVTPLGAKGLGEGTTMTAPAAIANAIADALGIDALADDIDVELP